MLFRVIACMGSLTVALAAMGCASRSRAPEPRVVSVDSPVETSPHSGRGLVAAGTVIPLRIDETLGTDLNQRGDVFHATVTRSLYGRGRGGAPELVVAAGARVTGVVARAEGGKAPILALELDTVETTHGVAPLRGRFTGNIPMRVDAPPRIRTTASVYHPDDPTVSPYEANNVSPWEPGGNVPHEEDARRLWLPAGTVLELELTRPIGAGGN